jgi:TolB-like protein/class 3 adenylate cyclase
LDRKLAAILAADVVGYSALMEADEAGTHERLKAGRKELFEPGIARHHGRIFKVMGDGLLAEFASVVDAVECAAALQRGLAARNADVSEDQRIHVRIGINLGEVIVEGDDRYGEGVNIAARLEQLAEPGGIYVSGKVVREVERKLAFGFEPMGEKRLKNIAAPVEAFRVKLDGQPAMRRAARPANGRWRRWAAAFLIALVLSAGLWLALHLALRNPARESAMTAGPAITDERPSLVVLPFDNLSDDKEQGYLADGITEDLTTDLARIPGLFVISRNAAFTYKGRTMKPAEIARELGVRYILEGSTRRVADDMRINAQLIDAKTGGHVWAQRFDGKWAEVFALQDKVVANVASALELKLVVGENTAQVAQDAGNAGATRGIEVNSKAPIAGGTNNAAAYDAYLRGLELAYRGTPEHTASAVPYFEKALTLDRKFGRASAELAWLYWNASGDKASEAALKLTTDAIDAKADAYLNDAARHPSPIYYLVFAERLIERRDFDGAVDAAQRGIALDPSNPYIFEELSWAFILSGRPAQGLDYLDAAMRVGPGWNSGRRVQAALAYIGLDRFEDAAAALEQADPRAEDSPYWSSFWLGYQRLRLLIATYGQLGRNDEAKMAMEQLKPYLSNEGDAEFTVLLAMNQYRFKHSSDLDRILTGLRKAGVPELPFGFDGQSKDRLTGPEIKSLVFGHEFQGRSRKSGDLYKRTTAPDGRAQVTLGNDLIDLMSEVEGDYLCSAEPWGDRSCIAFFRNPGGDAAHRNEYLVVSRREVLEFSVVK